MAYFLIVLMLTVGLLPMLVEAVRGRFDPFNLKNAFIAYFLLQLAISALPALMSGRASTFGPDPVLDTGYYEIALSLAVVGLAFFQLGYYASNRTHWKLPQLFVSPWRHRRVPFVATAFL